MKIETNRKVNFNKRVYKYHSALISDKSDSSCENLNRDGVGSLVCCEPRSRFECEGRNIGNIFYDAVSPERLL